MSVFVDTSALLAVLDAGDARHDDAARTLRSLVDDHQQLLTHNYVVVEAAALVRRKLGHPAARTLLQDIIPTIEILWIDEGTHVTAVSALLATTRTKISLVDHVSFDVMRKRGLERAFAFDDDFAGMGFALVPS